ncbi:expressed unknown protein [Seminavis robusta]|uniref:Uncharacterized protein n=1 Tax=Seminavis robusta TaxID=568900 RepID=A0A9N8F3J3_9STRA|nr:expressed unknown protein [Seminavis robusta]|eukprot:Sro3153_g344520.1 n/a (280) ;mRNA; f:1274-2113
MVTIRMHLSRIGSAPSSEGDMMIQQKKKSIRNSTQLCRSSLVELQRAWERQRRLNLDYLDYKHHFYDYNAAHRQSQRPQLVQKQHSRIINVENEYRFWTSKQSVIILASLVLAVGIHMVFFYTALMLFLYETGQVMTRWQTFWKNHYVIQEFRDFILSWWHFIRQQIMLFLDTNNYSRKAAVGCWLFYYPLTYRIVSHHLKRRKQQMLQLAKAEANRWNQHTTEAIQQARTIVRRSSLVVRQGLKRHRRRLQQRQCLCQYYHQRRQRQSVVWQLEHHKN